LASEDRLELWQTLFRKALRAIDSVGEPVFDVSNWSFGGGTVLMRRFGHRFSRDIDLFVPDPQYLGYLDPELNDAVEALTPRHLKAANFLRLYFDEGEVDFIAAAPVTDKPRIVERVLDRDVQVDTSIEIVGKKIQYRAAEFTARDMFDLSFMAEQEPGQLSKLGRVIRQRRETILARLASADRILRTTFRELDTLKYRPSYDHCLQVVRKVLGA